MSANRHAHVIDETASVAMLNLATELLDDGESVVVLDGEVALRGTPQRRLGVRSCRFVCDAATT